MCKDLEIRKTLAHIIEKFLRHKVTCIIKSNLESFFSAQKEHELRILFDYFPQRI